MTLTKREIIKLMGQYPIDEFPQHTARSVLRRAPQTEAEAADLLQGYRKASRPARQRPQTNRSRPQAPAPTSDGGSSVKRSTIARIAKEQGLGSSGAAALVSMGPASEAEARELAGLFAPNPTTVERINAVGHPSSGRTPGAQVVASAAYRQLCELADGPKRTVGRGDITVDLDWSPTPRAQTGADEYFPQQPWMRRPSRMEPTRARVPALVNEVDDVAGEIVRIAQETDRAEDAVGVPQGAQLGHSHINFAEEEFALGRWGTSATVSLDALRDPGMARSVFDRFVRDASMRALEDDMLNGDGSETSTRKQLLGVLNTSGVATVTRDDAGGESRLSAIARGGRTVLANEYTPGLAAVVNPADLQQLLDEEEAGGARTREVLELAGIDELAPSGRIAAGTAVVGRWDVAATLFSKGQWQLDVWNQHEDYAVRRLVLLDLSKPATFDVFPSGFCIVNGL